MFKRVLTIAGASAGLLASGAASAAFEDFCVNSLALSGTSTTALYGAQINDPSTGCTGVGSNTGVKGFTADKFNGGYTERLVVTGNPSPGVFSFQSTVFIKWGQYFLNDGGTGIDGVSSLLGNQYGLYSVVRATGTLSGGVFSATGATLELWADQFSAGGGGLTKQTLAGTVPQWDAGLNPILTGTGDDQLLASGNYSGGFGSASAPGRFTFTFKDLALTTLGNDYFIAPKPFYVDVLSDGDVDTNGFNVTGPGTFDLVGDVSANFFVPEPGSLALVGLALTGLGLTARRRRKA